MANHVRQQWREAIATAVTGLTTTGASVYGNRLYPFQTTDLPCLNVFCDGEDVEAITAHSPYQQKRDSNLIIEVYVIDISEAEDTLDVICKEVEIAIANSSSATVKGTFYRGVKFDISVVGSQPVGKAVMLFSKDLYTVSNAPDALIG